MEEEPPAPEDPLALPEFAAEEPPAPLLAVADEETFTVEDPPLTAPLDVLATELLCAAEEESIPVEEDVCTAEEDVCTAEDPPPALLPDATVELPGDDEEPMVLEPARLEDPAALVPAAEVDPAARELLTTPLPLLLLVVTPRPASGTSSPATNALHPAPNNIAAPTVQPAHARMPCLRLIGSLECATKQKAFARQLNHR